MEKLSPLTYLGQRLGEWSSKYGSSATRVKEYRAKGVRYFSNIGVAEFYMESGELRPGDEVVTNAFPTAKLDKIAELLSHPTKNLDVV